MQAKDYARSLYKHTDIESPPIKLDPILDALGIELFEGDVANVDGIAYKNKDSPAIMVHRDLTPERRRFAIAHELGHLVMPHSVSYRICPPERDSRVERDADRFAAELLVPEPTLRKLWPRYRDNVEYRVSILAELFEVSKTTMAIRVRQLRLK
ncbi:MAG TPA: ImmA/IrrE family metallo-endopeptidase [candidate division Zixibacteria bacterium]|nr:ImmA/IrrE family metallo-endopeptidase [candidate division Zixibacteria bacterium]